VNRPDEQQDQQQNQHQRHGENHEETYNPWSIVNLVFHHLADEGLHPILGGAGDPGAPAAQLLEALGIYPAPEGNRQVSRDVQQQLAQIRSAVFDDS
jgi:hypothetical protein